jgi:hypothetical protein
VSILRGMETLSGISAVAGEKNERAQGETGIELALDRQDF